MLWREIKRVDAPQQRAFYTTKVAPPGPAFCLGRAGSCMSRRAAQCRASYSGWDMSVHLANVRVLVSQAFGCLPIYRKQQSLQDRRKGLPTHSNSRRGEPKETG